MPELQSGSTHEIFVRALDEHGALPLERVVALMQKMMSHFDLESVLAEIARTAQTLFGAELVTLWMIDGEDAQLACVFPAATVPLTTTVGAGLAGICAAARVAINVPDVTADARFVQALDGGALIDRGSMLSVPIIGSDDRLTGVLQLLDEDGLPFDAQAESMACLLAAMIAVALQAVRLYTERMNYQRLQQEVDLARQIQVATLPKVMPQVPGYELYGHFQPADEAGGDLFDLVVLDGQLFILLGDATGHGFGPALSATQMQAMLRVAFRCGADLDQAYVHVNNQLSEDLPDNRFITAFMGFIDPDRHRVRFHSGGQGPILHWHAASNTPQWHPPTTFPFGAMQVDRAGVPGGLELARGDLLALISDGVYEYANAQGELFGNDRVAAVFARCQTLSLAELTARLLQAVHDFAGDVVQADDITLVLARRQA